MVDAKTVRLIRESWEPVYAMGPAAAEIFYENLFKLDPSIRKLFRSSDLKVQAARLFKMLNTAVDKLDDTDTLVPVLRDLGRRHIDYNVRPEHYAPVGAALMSTLEQALGDRMEAEHKAAWGAVYNLVSNTMQAGACTDPDAARLGYPVAASKDSAGKDEGPISARTITLVRESWKPVQGLGPAAIELFYSNLFEANPDVKALFRNSNLKQQAARLFKMLDTAVEKLDDVGTLVPVLKDLGRRHVDYKVRPEHYPPVGAALLATLAQALKDSFTPETKEAWVAVYTIVADTMTAGACEDPDAAKLGYKVTATAAAAAGGCPAHTSRGSSRASRGEGAGVCPVMHEAEEPKGWFSSLTSNTPALVGAAVAGAAIATAVVMAFNRGSRGGY